jgi:hypothetical protein
MIIKPLAVFVVGIYLGFHMSASYYMLVSVLYLVGSLLLVYEKCSRNSFLILGLTLVNGLVGMRYEGGKHITIGITSLQFGILWKSAFLQFKENKKNLF